MTGDDSQTEDERVPGRPEDTEPPREHIATGPRIRTADPRPVAAATDANLDDPAVYLNRELSELAFQRRVLYEAEDERNPLLERVRFLSIFTRNVDEFFMKRIGGLKQQLAADVTERSPDGRTPAEQLAATFETVESLYDAAVDCWRSVRDELADAGIEVLGYDDLTRAECDRLREYFESSVLPTLTPLTVGPGQPFPFISNLSLSLGVLTRTDDDEVKFSRVKVPENRPRLVPVDAPGDDPSDPTVARYVHMSDVIGANLDLLFPNVPVLDRCTFRVTRNAEVRRNEDVAEGLISAIEGVLRDRRFATVVRLELETSTPDRVRELLIERLGLDDREVLTRPGPLDFGDLDALVDLDRPKLKLEPWTPRPHPRLGESGRDDFFAEVRRREVLVHHPYHSFEGTVQAFLTAAARDPDVLAVKVAIYRTAPDSEVVEALLEAARNGKQVAVMVELRARFDEANNLRWVRRLEEEGVHVAYGDIGLKTHSKVALVVREEDDGESGPAVRTYAHVGTGNYHAGTAKGYVDLGLLTADSDVGQDLVRLFNSFTAHAAAAEYRKLLVAPTTLRSEMTDRVRRETDRAREGEPAGITAVMNSLEDPAMVRELYRASRAGVDVDLVVRGICRLRPGVSGLSESVTVRSIVGRFLEHSRVFRFENGGDREYFIGSADWMTRNLDRRVEAVVPVEDPDHRAYLDYVLTAMLADDRKAWVLDGDGGYTQLRPEGDEDGESVHDRLMRLARAATEGLTVGSELRNGDVG